MGGGDIGGCRKGDGVVHGLGGLSAKVNVKVPDKGMETGISADRDGEGSGKVKLWGRNLVQVKVLVIIIVVNHHKGGRA